MEDSLVLPGFVEDEDLPRLYRRCSAFVFSSEYEGFGLPPLEALACGTVPLVLNRTSLAEVYQGMAGMVERADPESIRRGLEGLLEDEDLRRGMLDRFVERRSRFSWRKAAADLSRLIRKTVGWGRL